MSYRWESFHNASHLSPVHTDLLLHWKKKGFEKQKHGRKSGPEMLCWMRGLTLCGNNSNIDSQKPYQEHEQRVLLENSQVVITS